MNGSRRGIGILVVLLVVAAGVAVGVAYAGRSQSPQAVQTEPTATGAGTSGSASTTAASDDFASFMYDAGHSGFNAGEVRLSPDNAANLKLQWKVKLGGGQPLAAQPVVVSDTIYEGSWDGNLYALSTKDGSVKWKVDLGRTTSKRCEPSEAGITSAVAATSKALYVGGGDSYLYALKPDTGEVIWKFKTGDNSEEGGAYNWDSPVVYKGRVYYGIASFCDQPFPNGRMWGLNADTGKVEQEVHFVPDNMKGGGLWTSPTLDESTGSVFVTTASADYYIPNTYSMARLDPQSLAVVDAWQIPIDQQVNDGDWGTTPTLFHDQNGKLMVGAAAKNGNYYAFKADDIHSGPAWSARISDGGSCPECGEGALSNSVYAYDTVYVAAGYLSLGVAQKFAGTIHAFDPTTGAVKWIHPTRGSVLPAMVAANGLVVAAGEDMLEVVNAATGDLLWDYSLDATTYGPPTIAHGVLYATSVDGYLYAFSAGLYPDADKLQPYKVAQVGANPPQFTPFRKPVELPPLPTPTDQTATTCFTQTNKCILPDFVQYWQDNGGLDRFGPPVSRGMLEGGRTVQYFRNAVLELHAKEDGTGNEVRMGKLDFRLFYYTPKDEHFDDVSAQPGATYYPDSHHNLADPFLTFWKEHGGVNGLGYPVSEPLDEYNVVDNQTRHVQYFERGRLEVVQGSDGKEQIQFGAMGLQLYLQRYGKMP